MDSPKRSASPSTAESKRVKLNVPDDPDNAPTPVDPDNAQGKRSELDPIHPADIANLPPDDPSQPPSAESGSGNVKLLKADAPEGAAAEAAENADVDMPDAGAEEDNESADEPDEDDPAAVDAARQRLEDQARKYLAAQTHDVVIPSYAAWFDMQAIHPVERRALPEFFNSRNRSKSPAIYKDYRDFMINTYRLRPTEYLTVTACRRNLAGDVCAIMRVHAFLEQWGLINYQVDPEARPAALVPPFTGHFRVILDTPRGLQSLHPGTRPNPNPQQPSAAPSASTPATPIKPTSTPASLALRSSIYQTTSKASRPLAPAEAAALAAQAQGQDGGGATPNGTAQKGGMSYQCDTCGADCTALRYHSLTTRDFELCAPCYLGGRFPSRMFSGDFVKLAAAPPGVPSSSTTSGAAAGEDAWTDQETLLLLEGIELHEDDWAAIAAHVGTRTAQACVKRFLALPIEDEYVAAEGEQGPLRYARVPFEQADNPVMSVVAFLAGAVAPPVAAEAARAAMGALAGERGALDGEGEKDGEEKEGEGEEEGMEEDLPPPLPTDADAEDSAMDGAPSSASPTSTSQQKKPQIPHTKVARAASLALSASAKAAARLAAAEDTRIRSSIQSLVRLTLDKLELKMSMFEELEGALEEERRALEGARIALVAEREGLRRMLEGVRGELGKMSVQDGAGSGSTSNSGGAGSALAAATAPGGMGTTGQGTRAVSVASLEGGGVPQADGDFAQLG
ncbi:SWIRM-domain-containing protein [Coniophora puteana RWD-64-598 SS2]|uniref:SWIRM-domain-containing protein n=1 Tax=Coniophora puteana (strain RWD-64-598) TaxID=741705 RepID=A0A5M3MGL4_CONPW|nr:SWIRM-domain-containing protein [Coniophora puteana RWD-64-598 SS2]EIW78362.1 SWIRM-domain-containing protein [Coniophora puteana RWD-64-598 SS2]